MKSEIKCPCGCGSSVEPSKPEDDLSLESFDACLRIISMPLEQMIELEEKGKTKDLAEYES